MPNRVHIRMNTLGNGRKGVHKKSHNNFYGKVSFQVKNAQSL